MKVHIVIIDITQKLCSLFSSATPHQEEVINVTAIPPDVGDKDVNFSEKVTLFLGSHKNVG